MDAISVFTPVPSSINNGTIKSFGVRMVSATIARIAGVCRKIRLRRCRYIDSSLIVYPITRMQTRIQQLSLRTSRYRLIVIFPPGPRRQAHQYTLRPAARLQPEQRPPVMDQVELHIASPADLLPPDFPFPISQTPPPLRDRQISRQKTIANRLLELEQPLSPGLIRGSQMIIKYAANAPDFSATMPVNKIFVTALFEPRVVLFSENIHRIPEGLVKMHRIVREKIIRRKIRSAAEPPVGGNPGAIIKFKIAPVR